MTNELDSMVAELAALTSRIREIDLLLKDYYVRRTDLKTKLIESYPHKEVDWWRGPIVAVATYTRDNLDDRKSLRGELDRLGQVNAPLTRSRRNLAIEADGLRKAIARLQVRHG